MEGMGSPRKEVETGTIAQRGKMFFSSFGTLILFHFLSSQAEA